MGGENVLLFAFELEVDAERVIQGEPWAFDRHLVVFEKFEGYAPIHTLGFKTTAFWVQVHYLPFPLQTIETAFNIGETIGPVIKPKDLGEMLGPNFMRVRVVVDISKPLCRGRKIYWDKDNEGWAAFMSERLPNICYWCGSVSHDDKDCSLWLRSKGTLTVAEQQFGPWIRAPLFNPAKKSFVEVKGYEDVNNGAGGGVTSDAWASHGLPRLNQGFENTITSSDSRATNENSLVPRCEDGSMDDDEYVSSSMKPSETLQAVKDDARVVPNFEAQLQALDNAINISPVLPNLKIDKLGVVSAAAPIFSHAKSCINVSKEIQGLNKEEVRYVVDSVEASVSAAAPIFSHAKSCITVSKECQGLNKEEVRYDVDSLEAIRIEEFKVGQNSITKEKKSTCGRPRKYPQGELLHTENISPVHSRKSSQATRTLKKTWKHIADKKEISAEKAVAGLDIGEKRKSAEIDRMEDHSPEGEKRKKLEVCSTSLTAEVAQQPRRAQ